MDALPPEYHQTYAIEQRLDAAQLEKLRGKSPLERVLLAQSASPSPNSQNPAIEALRNLGAKVDATTYWTPEKFRNEIVNSDKVTYVYWRREGLPDVPAGDELLRKLIEDFPEIDRFIVIELTSYHNERKKFNSDAMGLLKIPSERNKKYGPIIGLSGSIFKYGNEFRIRGPPTDDYPYERGKSEIKRWLGENKGRAEMR